VDIGSTEMSGASLLKKLLEFIVSIPGSVKLLWFYPLERIENPLMEGSSESI
jgi:hypothetical protein